jgi:hypothetical protein
LKSETNTYDARK